MNLELFKRPKKAPQYPNITSPTEYAFSVKGVDYWRFTDAFNMPPVRALKAVTFFEEARMRMDAEYMELETKAVDHILSQQVIDIFKIKTINEQKKDRLAWKMPTLQMLYRVASVMYFDKSEHPANYDFAYNEQKIERWKKYGKPGIDFFLQMPLVDLMPFLTEPAENLRLYSAVVEELNQVHLENLSTILATVSK